ncbi:hypothetical protein ILYODFUR_039197 [Ilyodon furcidens]|uniref:Uncharacterized protein n=1 Tax=Ilyodon furcidens TaxID=33524 RepID=A0ABV0UG60_9TELE
MVAGVSSATFLTMELPITRVGFSAGVSLSGENLLERRQVGGDLWAARALLKDCYGELTSVAPRWLRGLDYLLVFQQRGAGPPIPTPSPLKLQKCYIYYTYHYH